MRPHHNSAQIRSGSPEHSATARLSRRSLLALLAVAPFVALAAHPATADQPRGLVMHNGWMLRADDLERLKVA
ncbi:MAG: hypothetical protein JWN11_923 [Hyphomicrobiales bacterium]|jgi:hypothetical protein|nr:hypothetical protein [Hyphomicrobiales bacterium]